MANSSWVAASGTWTAASNWSAGVPGPSDTALFDTGNPSSYVVQGPGTAGTLTVNDPAVDLAGTITDVLGLVAGVASGTSTTRPFVRLSGPGTSWTNTGGLLLGTLTSLTMSDGATLAVGATGLTISSSAVLALDPTTSLSGPLVLDGTLVVQNGTTGAANTPLTLSDPMLLAGQGTVTTTLYSSDNQTPYAGTLTLAGSVTGTGGLTVGSTEIGLHGTVDRQTGNTVVLSGRANSYAGGTSLESGTLVLATAGAAGSGPISIGLGTLAVAAGATAPVISDLGVSSVINADAGLSAFETSGSTLTFLNGAGHSTVIGGNGATSDIGHGTIYGGTGSVTVFGGINVAFGGSAGGNLLVSTAVDTLVGGGSGDLLVGNGGNDLLVAGAGNETLTSAGESGSGAGALIYGGPGADVIAAGTLYDTVVAGSGAATIFGGAADPNILYAGSGTDVIVTGGRGDFVQVGTGSSSIFAAQGANLVTFVNGGAGGSDVITGFKVGTDTLALRGYAGSGTQAGLANTQVAGSSTVLTLTDGTRVTLVGVANLGAASFV